MRDNRTGIKNILILILCAAAGIVSAGRAVVVSALDSGHVDMNGYCIRFSTGVEVSSDEVDRLSEEELERRILSLASIQIRREADAAADGSVPSGIRGLTADVSALKGSSGADHTVTVRTGDGQATFTLTVHITGIKEDAPGEPSSDGQKDAQPADAAESGRDAVSDGTPQKPDEGSQPEEQTVIQENEDQRPDEPVRSPDSEPSEGREQEIQGGAKAEPDKSSVPVWEKAAAGILFPVLFILLILLADDIRILMWYETCKKRTILKKGRKGTSG